MKCIRWVLASSFGGWLLAQVLGADRMRLLEVPAAPLLSFTPFVAAAAPLSALLFRRKRAAVIAGVAAGAVVVPRSVKRRQPAAGGAVVSVLTANLLYGGASTSEIVDLVRSKHVDILFVQELTEVAALGLAQAGLGELLAHEITDVRGNTARGSGIYARHPLTAGLSLERIEAAQPTARIALATGELLDLVCVHPHPPSPPFSRRRIEQWRDELAQLPSPADSPTDPLRVLAGDFNATLDHAPFRRLLAAGYVDAAQQRGKALVPTWGPFGKPAIITIDHVLLDPRCAVLDVSVHALSGSDHRAVWAKIRVPSALKP